jgi:hypothetical protein
MIKPPIELQNDGILDFGHEAIIGWGWADDLIVRITNERIMITNA